MPLKISRLIIFFVLLQVAIISIKCLHLQSPFQQQSSQLKRLKQQQKLLGSEVNDLISSVDSVSQQIQTTNDQTQKVQILQKALNVERQRIFDLQNQLKYPLNQSQTKCSQLTEKQKTNLLAKLQISKKKINELQTINNKFNKSLLQVENIDDKIQKQFVILKNIEDTLLTKCKKNISPTIFQSNLNVNNWILGPQTMKDLQQQYTKRAMIFHNITNCPQSTPFFNPIDQICIQCVQPNSIFDMYAKQCSKCQIQEILDIKNRVCKPKPHNTNFTKVQNWYLGNGVLPQTDPKLTPCPDDSPYFNGFICVTCQLPKFWNVTSNLCQKCNLEFQFDLNTKKCEKIALNYLTILQNTKWVSSNITKVIQDRVIALKKNATTGRFHYCSAQTPYYDGTTCISCEFFDIDNKKCVSPSNGTQYNGNMKKFLKPEQNKQTNILTNQKYVSSKVLVDTDIPNCNLTHSFFDGMACIQCLNPFNIFNIDQKKCIICDPEEIYIQLNHTCTQRLKIYISDNYNKLLATDTVTVPQFKKSILKKINDNPESLIYPCQKGQYSNFKSCFNCQDNEYFNIQTLNCTLCDGIYQQTNQTCKLNVYIFTNLKAANLIDMEGKSIDSQTKSIEDFLKTHKTSYMCPLDKPFALDNKVCGTCPILFSYSTKKCTQCPEYFVYLSDQRKCQQGIMTVNFMDTSKILVNEKQTLVSFKAQQQDVSSKNSKIAKICPGDKPYTQNRQFCFKCTDNSPYFNYTIKQCQSCPQNFVFDAKAVRCIQQYYLTLFNNQTQPRMLGYMNYTLSNYKVELEGLKKSYPYLNCTLDQPFGTLSGCTQCSDPHPYFDIKKKQCSSAKYLINYPKISTDYILPSDKTLDNFVADEQNFKKTTQQLTTLCPADKPYTNDRTNCFSCNAGQYFNLGNKQCQTCPQGNSYVKQLKLCKQLFFTTYFAPKTQLKMRGYSNYTLANYKNDQNILKSNNPYQNCTQSAPFGTQGGCVDCSQPTPYFDIKRKICSSAKKLVNFTAITTNYTLPDGKNLTAYQDFENNFKIYSQSITIECPSGTPFTQNRDYCFQCQQPDYLFNFQTKKCESCPKGSKYIPEKKKCSVMIYLTNINPDSQIKMISFPEYTLDNFKIDQTNLKAQNPYEYCTVENPYGTNDGCTKCFAPEQYFNIKNRLCTSVKKLINFNTTIGLITAVGKRVVDYQTDENNFEKSSPIPTILCPINLPFTSNHDECFTCTTPSNIFNLETKNCQSCASGEIFDKGTNKCLKKQYSTLFTNTTENKLMETDNLSLDQYKSNQVKIKSLPGSELCTIDKPYATINECIACNTTNPYFNIELNTCIDCPANKKFNQAQHKCLTTVFVSDFSNKNILLPKNMIIDQAKALQVTNLQTGTVQITCPSTTPYATANGCISCQNSSLPLFNFQSKICQNCRQFYQYFEGNQCKENIILTNTKSMIGYIETDNYTKYNIEKFNNLTYLSNKHVVDCPSEKPFYNEVQCIACPLSQPVFDLMNKNCIKRDEIKMSNHSAMTFYIQQGDQTLDWEKKEATFFSSKNVSIQYCPSSMPYLSGGICIKCPDNSKYFNLATQQCQTCDPGQICKQQTVL